MTPTNTTPVRKPATRRRAILGNLLVLAVTLIVGALLGEFAVRMFRPQQLIVPRPEMYRADNLFGWRHRENVDTTLNSGEGLIRFNTDARGYRIDPKTVHPKADVRVLMLGDSFLEATGVRTEAVVSELLQTDIANATHKSVIVDNTGVGGWDPNQYLLEAKRAFAGNSYDLGIVMIYIGNDFVTKIATSYPPRQPSQLHSFRMPKKLTSKEWIDAILYPINDTLETRSHLFQLVKKQMDIPLSWLGLTASYFPPVFLLTDQSSSRWDVTTTICRSIAEEFASHKVPVIFVLVPTPYQVDKDTFETYRRAFKIDPKSVDLEQPNKLMNTRLRQANLTVLDPLEEMRKVEDQGQELYGSFDSHLNANGHKELAKLLMPFIASSLVH
ncbi:MAG: hypothetical protein ABI824_09365 [Acidobacteriota bacterium]